MIRRHQGLREEEGFQPREGERERDFFPKLTPERPTSNSNTLFLSTISVSQILCIIEYCYLASVVWTLNLTVIW